MRRAEVAEGEQEEELPCSLSSMRVEAVAVFQR
jgi:hypothetical protein